MSDLRARAASFGTVAAEYERARPDYPSAVVAWFAEQLDIGPGRTVLDLAAGTGKLTKQLAELGGHVVAVEPSAAMRVELERAVPGADALAGTAEAIPLEDEAVDAITSAQAFHWFEADRALGEMSRVLRPGGGVGLVWNVRDESDRFQVELSEIVDETDRSWHLESHFSEAVMRSGHFGEIVRMTCPHEQWLLRSQVVERVASMSAVAVLDDVERAHVYSRVRALAGAAAEPIRFAYTTEAFAFRLI